MGLVLKRKIEDNGFIGIWQTNETIDELLEFVKLNKYDLNIFSSFTHETRKLHWLSARALLKEFLPNENLKIVYDSNSKPFIDNSNYHISISHSHEKVAIIISNKSKVGIDIERMKHNIERLKEKFMSDEELKNINGVNNSEKLYIYWGAKESLFKIYGKGNVIFAKNLFIESFDYKAKGEVLSQINIGNFKENYKIFYEEINEYMLVYATNL